MRRLWLAPLVLVVALVYAWLDGNSGFGSAKRLREDLHAARERIASQRLHNEALRAEARALREDPFAREQAIREDLDFARPGEIVVRMPREDGDAKKHGTPRIP